MKVSILVAFAALTSFGAVAAEKANTHSAQPGVEKQMSSTEQPTQLVTQTTCPVMEGNAIDKKFFAEHEGKRVYFCCKSCVAAFNKNPAQYLKKLESMGQKPELIASQQSTPAALAAQSTCPVMGGKINKKLFVDQDGQRIYVCCAGCIDPIKKDFSGHVKKLEASGQRAEVLQ